MAKLHNIQLRTGCFCNPGACQRHMKLSDSELKKHFRVSLGHFHIRVAHFCMNKIHLLQYEQNSFSYEHKEESTLNKKKLVLLLTGRAHLW